MPVQEAESTPGVSPGRPSGSSPAAHSPPGPSPVHRLLGLARSAWSLGRETVASWQKDNAAFMAAGLAYFAVFSLAPFALLAIALAGYAFGEAAAEGIIVQQLEGLLSEPVSRAIQDFVAEARKAGTGSATAVGTLLLVVGASRIFVQLRTALDMIWGVAPPPVNRSFGKSLLGIVWKRAVSFSMVVGVGLIMGLAFLTEALLGVFRKVAGSFLPVLGHVGLWELASLAVSFLTVLLLTAAIFKFLPDTQIRWKDVWVGAAVTSLLLTLGRYAIGLYFRFSDVASLYGIAGTVLVIFVGIYLAAMVFLLGAEFTWVYAHRHGSRARATALPEKHGAGLPGVAAGKP